jgi:SAM-dependent methyltransferase
MNTVTCNLCNGQAQLKHAEHPGYREGLRFDIYECTSCGASFSFPIVADEKIYQSIYDNIAIVPGYSRYFGYANQIQQEACPLDYLVRQEESYWAAGTHLAAHWPASGDTRLLEVGCGLGYFTYALVQAGYDAIGMDISARAVRDACNRYGNYYECTDLGNFARGSKGRFDVAVMNQLIEHVPDIKALIKDVLDLLKPQGEIIITTPNKSVFPDSTWETELPPVHLWWLSAKSLERIAEEFGLSLTLIDFTDFYEINYRQYAPIPKHHVLDSDSKVVIRENGWQSGCNKLLTKLHLKDTYRNLRDAATGKKRISGSQGPVLAAVMKKN